MAIHTRTNSKRQLSLKQQDVRIAWLLIIPSLIVILGVTLWPIISTLVLSLYDAPTGINQVRTFVGPGNYRRSGSRWPRP